MPGKIDIAEARKFIRKKWGKMFETKCGNTLALHLYKRARLPTEATINLPILLTFKPINLESIIESVKGQMSNVTRRVSALTAAGESQETLSAMTQVEHAITVQRDSEFFSATEPDTLTETQRAKVQSHIIEQIRNEALSQYRDVIDHLCKYVPLGMVEATRTAEKRPSKNLMECWLTGSLRVEAPPDRVAEVAEQSKLVVINSPRKIFPEIFETALCLGGPQLRQKRNLDGTGVKVAVIDTEVDSTHPGLRNRVQQGTNFSTEHWGNPDPHGTAVAGIIASDGTGSPRSRSIIGIAPRATILNYKIIPKGEDFFGSLAIQEAYTDGTQVINCSWFVSDSIHCDGSCETCRAVTNVWVLGVPVVKSAGNRGPGRETITCPANAHSVISVGSTNRDGTEISGFSSRGRTIDGRLKPEVVAPGEAIWTCLPGSRYGASENGTSFAAPHITGLLTLLLQENMNRTPDDLLTLLKQNSKAGFVSFL